MFMGICKGHCIYIYINIYISIYIYQYIYISIYIYIYQYIYIIIIINEYTVCIIYILSDTIMGKNGIRKNIISHNGDDSSLEFYDALIFFHYVLDR